MLPTSGFKYIRFKSQTSSMESGRQAMRKPNTEPQLNQEFMFMCCVLFSACSLPVMRLVAADGSKQKSRKWKKTVSSSIFASCSQFTTTSCILALSFSFRLSAHLVVSGAQGKPDKLWAVASGGRKCSKKLEIQGERSAKEANLVSYLLKERERVRETGAAGRGGEKTVRVWEGAVIC